jgi:hypothetical protein
MTAEPNFSASFQSEIQGSVRVFRTIDSNQNISNQHNIETLMKTIRKRALRFFPKPTV